MAGAVQGQPTKRCVSLVLPQLLTHACSVIVFAAIPFFLARGRLPYTTPYSYARHASCTFFMCIHLSADTCVRSSCAHKLIRGTNPYSEDSIAAGSGMEWVQQGQWYVCVPIPSGWSMIVRSSSGSFCWGRLNWRSTAQALVCF